MKKLCVLCLLCVLCASAFAQERRPIDAQHPLWMIHVDVWNAADPQKIIDLVPEDIRPYVCMNLSLSCQFDTDKDVYKMPQNAVRTYKSWASVCQQNGLWFTCQPASGGHTHLQDTDLETFEYFFRRYPNFLGWNFAEQFWGFDEKDRNHDKSSSFQADRIALFAKLVEMSHQYGGFLTISFCGNIWSHGLNPIGMLKRSNALMKACRNYPEAILWLYKYTTSSCFYNNESVTYGPFVAGLAKSYGVRYDNCGWNGAMDALLGEGKAKYPIAAGVGTVMEQTAVNGGAVWDGPELIWTEDFKETARTTVSGYTRRNWATFEGFQGVWIDMFRKILDGTLYIPTREEVIGKTKIVVINSTTSGSDEDKYAAWGNLYDGVYKQTDPMNRNQGQWMDNFCYFKSTGRYGAIPIVPQLYDDLAKTIPVRVSKSAYSSRWSTIAKKTAEFNTQYPEVSTGDLYVNRYRNQLVTYTPYSYLNSRTTATGSMPLLYNTCDSLILSLGKLGSGLVHEYADHIDFYLNNFRTDTTAVVTETIVVKGATQEPTFTLTKRNLAKGSATAQWDAGDGTYTLTVKHLGAVDISINCAGAGVDRLTDVVPSATLTADLPKQPSAYHGEIIVEAEDMDYKDVRNSTTSPYYSHPDVRGHAGNGFVEMGTSTAGSLRHQLTVSEAGDYRISVRYTSPTKAGKIRSNVNNRNAYLNIEKTAENEWRKATFDVALKAGQNTLTLTNSGAVPVLIDQVIYTPADVEPEKYLITIRKASYGTLTADVEEAAEGDLVTLTIAAREGYGLKELQVTNGVNFTMKSTISLETLENGNTRLTFQMPDDIVTLQPVFAKGVNIADGIRLVDADGTRSATIYDLSGRRVSAPQSKGIYVRNGRRVVVK
ncbi:MAG: glycosyl hydrolase family 98 [Bacteroidaceae bacterium]|nr:glycosyl hydrolase family 98 [Bacteroidaceae bacterium]